MLHISVVAACLLHALAQPSSETASSETHVQVATTSGFPATCGCGWTHHSACSISAHQFVQALQHSRVDKMCNETSDHGDPSSTAADDAGDEAWAAARARRECWIRKEIRTKAQNLEQCAGIAHQAQCGECSWGAQATNECGISVSRLLAAVLGHDIVTSYPPLLEALYVHDVCAGFDYSSCQKLPQCSWRRGACDMNEGVFYHRLLHRPNLLNMFILANGGAKCRAHYEHGQADGEDGVCEDPCVLEHGICHLNVNKVGHFPLQADQNHSAANITMEMFDHLCMRLANPGYHGKYATFEHMCRSPCVTVTQNFSGTVHNSCRAPNQLPSSISTDVGLDDSDWLVMEAFMVIQSSTMIYEHHCQAFTDNYDMCQASSVNCEEDWKPVFTTTTYAAGYNMSTPSSALPRPAHGGPFKGFLGEVFQAVDKGTLPELFGDYVESYARMHTITDEDRKELEEDVELVKRWMEKPREMHHAHEGFKTQSPWVKWSIKDVDADQKLQIGIFMIGSSFLVAAFSCGVALRVLCHAMLASPLRQHSPRTLRPLMPHGYNDQELGQCEAIPATEGAE